MASPPRKSRPRQRQTHGRALMATHGVDGKDDIMGQQDNQEVQEIKVVEEDLAVGELQAERLLPGRRLPRLLRRASLQRVPRR